MKVEHPFRTGLVGALGVLLALAIGSAVAQLATVLTYVLAAVFLALGLDPIIRVLQHRLRLPKWAALLLVVVVLIGVIALLLFSVIPVIVDQTSQLVTSVTAAFKGLTWQQFLAEVQRTVGTPLGLDVDSVVDQTTAYLQKNVGGITSGVLSVGLGVLSGVAGTVVVIILTLYFTASIDVFKGALYRLVPMSRRERFASIAEQIFQSVGRYVIGQVGLALVNGILSFVFLLIIRAPLPAVFAFIAFLGSLIPLVGTISAAVLIVVGQFLLNPIPSATWIVVAVYYLVYMQVEAYLLSPNIMRRAVKVPGVVVVIAALTGGTLLGVLGALIAIPVAAAILLVIDQVVVPRPAAA